MRALALLFTLFLSVSQLRAGGASSTLQFNRISSVEVQDEKIILKGSFIIHMRLVHENSEFFENGRAKNSSEISSRVKEGTVILVPDYSDSTIANLYVGGAKPEDVLKKHKTMFEQLWQMNLESARALGDTQKVSISFQGVRVTITGGRIVEVCGYGRLPRL
ncbi:hypothetical protein [Roseibacillus persicicus]|uniref:hypothetical protein n=1 Tax=Roseibacillus persicicus TaxID=454148 RepID=UPI00280DCDDC|nr:hypothetical protein [Roseibacillus persicicus]MDQ8192691.1 hypothetical protein [Roseibacillus persicicus]